MRKRKLLTTAVLAALPALAAGQAGAVSLSPTGAGEVLIFPYYTVRNGFDTYVSITNSSYATKAVKVRFREGMNGAPVLDFNLFLSPVDTWVGAIADNGSGARLVFGDSSCAIPSVPLGESVNFSNAHYSGLAPGFVADAGTHALDRTREGFVEVIEMGQLSTAATGGTGSSIVQAVRFTLATNGPANCAAIQTASLTTGLLPPSGGLYGNGYLVKSEAGLEFSYDAVALVDFAPSAANGLWQPQGSTLPDLGSADPVSVQFAAYPATYPERSSLRLVQDNWVSGIDAVSSLLMNRALMNDHVLEAATNSQTDWVVTFPTKRGYVNGANGVPAASAVAPFQRPFTGAAAAGTVGSACDDWVAESYNRQGFFLPPPLPPVCPGVCPSSPPVPRKLCYQTNVISFQRGAETGQSAGLLGSRLSMSDVDGNAQRVHLRDPAQPAINYDTGWTRVSPVTPTLSAPIVTRALVGSVHSFTGLPAVGFMLQTFVRTGLVINGTPAASGFGGGFAHRYERDVRPR